MDYPMANNCLTFKQNSDDTYTVTNYLNNEVVTVGSGVVYFLEQLNGYTHPYDIDRSLEPDFVDELLDKLRDVGFIRESLFFKESAGTYLYALHIPKNRTNEMRPARIICFFLSWLILILWVPLLGFGIFSFVNNQLTTLSFENASNNETYRKDITEDFNMDEIDTCLSIINNNEKVKRFIVDFLKTFWNTEFPFNANDLELADIIALNRFKGFDKTYYYAIPYELGTYKIEGSFKVFSNSSEAINAFQQSSLPKSKTIKKALFNNQGLLMYIPELESLYIDIGNVSIFNEIINAPYIQVLLHYLHTYPSINQFISDYCKSGEQTRKFANLLRQSVGLTCELAKEYAGRSDFYKQKMLEGHFKDATEKIERFDRDYFYLLRPSINSPYSMPMQIPECVLNLEDTVFDCDFRFLRTTNDTNHAGKVLSNCLQGWNCSNENVLVIKRGIAIVAAVQLSHRHTIVEQAKLAHNDNIEADERIYRAFWAWCNKHQLVFPEHYWDDDGEDDDDDEEIA